MVSKFQFDRMQDLPENHCRVSGAPWVNITIIIIIIIIIIIFFVPRLSAKWSTSLAVVVSSF